jgi:hypothetical protein
MLSSCYTKQAAIKKFCKTTSLDTTITVHDTVIVDKITADTIFSTSVDSVIVTKDKLIIKYIKKDNLIYLDATYTGDTIYTIKEVPVTVNMPCPDNTTKSFWVKTKDATLNFFALLGLIAMLVFLFKSFVK